MFYRLWLKRVLLSPHNLFQFGSLFSLFGLALGVASLTTALLVVEGFSAGLKRAIWDISGQVIILAEERGVSKEILSERIKPYKNQIENRIDFLSFEGLILKDGKFKGALFNGMDKAGLKKNSRFLKRITHGALPEREDFIIVGKGLAEDLKLQVGSRVPVVVPGPENSTGFSRKKKVFTVEAIADFGRHVLNSRYVLMSLSSGRFLKGQREEVSGTRLWLKDAGKAEAISLSLRQKNPYFIVSSWRDLERNFFKVIEMDKKIIFFVLLILVLAAGFNVSGSLFVNVFRRTREISILKAMGAGESFIAGLFLMEGLVLGILGAVTGLGLGWSICFGLLKLQNRWNFIPLDVYQVNEIVLRVKATDVLVVLLVTIAVSFLASLAPALRAYRMNVTEGLAWE